MDKFEKIIGPRVKNSNYTFKNGLNILLVNEKFNGCSLKRTFLKDSKVYESKFIECAFTGSRFCNTSFSKCKIECVNLQFSSFDNCKFKNLNEKKCLKVDNFDHCYFYKTTFRNVKFDGCSISCSNFIECTFENCEFYASTLECTVFTKCTFINVEMIDLNIEFSQMIKCDMTNITFPFTQLPYIIGFSEFKDMTKVKVAAEHKTFSFIEYQNYFHDLKIYYNHINENFAIANIYLYQGKTEEAIKLLNQELQVCLLNSDYRMIKHICRLATLNENIGVSKIRELFNLVTAHLDKIDTINQTIECINNIDEIRRLIMEAGYNKTALKIIIETNIPSNDIDSISAVIKTIEETIENTLPNCYSKSIEIRHNSPYELFLQLYQSMDQIELVINEIINSLPIVESGISILCSSLALKDRIKNRKNKSIHNKNYITKIFVIVE